MTKSVFMFLAFISMASAATYTIQDLNTLVQKKDFAEALQHMKDVSPTERNEQWMRILKNAAIGEINRLKDTSCKQSFMKAQSLRTEHSILESDDEIKKLQKESGLCLIKKMQYSSTEEREKFVDEMVKVDAKIIYDLFFFSGYSDPNGRLRTFLNANADLYKDDPRVKEYLLKNAVAPTPEVSVKVDLKAEVINQMKEALMDEYAVKLKPIADDMMKGEFKYDFKGYELTLKMQKFDLPLDRSEEVARFVVPLMIVATNTHERLLPLLKKLKTQHIKSATNELISTKVESQFWFSGNWEDKTAKDLIRTYFPNVLLEAQKECNAKAEPAHVVSGACEWLKKF